MRYKGDKELFVFPLTVVLLIAPVGGRPVSQRSGDQGAGSVPMQSPPIESTAAGKNRDKQINFTVRVRWSKL